MQKIAEEYANRPITFMPGERLHRLVAMLCDTWYDDLTDDRIRALEAQVETFRWCNADGESV